MVNPGEKRDTKFHPNPLIPDLFRPKLPDQDREIATLGFTGTGIRWIGAKSDDYGKAMVYIDNVLATSTPLDLYSSIPTPPQIVFEKKGLAKMINHSIKIQVTGLRNKNSKGFAVPIDAFEILP